MKIASLVARILRGLMFLAGGVAGFFIVNTPPPAPTPMATAFQNVYFASRYVLFVDSFYILIGVALLLNRYLPLALVALAAIIVNIYIFHITMTPLFPAILAPIVVTIFWLLVALPLKRHFEPLLAAKASANV